jgi:hypothetical protein
VRLPFVTKTGVSQISNKLRRDGERSVSFLPSNEPGVHLSDVDVSHFFR